MRRPQGYLVQAGGDGPDLEFDTVTCGHCGHIAVQPPTRQLTPLAMLKQLLNSLAPANQCRACMRYLCDGCAGSLARGGGCRPFEKRLDEYEKRNRLGGIVLK